ncbi:MAG: NlpC/P60 family protein [Thermoleophilia bacterium]
MNGRRTLITLMLLLFCGLTIVALTVPPSSQASTLKQRLQAVDAKLNVLYAQEDAAVERYDTATGNLRGVVAQIAANQQMLPIAQAQVKLAQTTLDNEVVATYEQDQPGILDVVLDTSSFDQLLTQFNAWQRFGAERVQILTSVQAARQKLLDLQTALVAEKAAAARLVVQAGQQRDTVRALVKQQQAVAGGLQQQIKQQQIAAAAAARRAAQAAQAAAVRQAAAAAAAASAQSQGASGSGGASGGSSGSSTQGGDPVPPAIGSGNSAVVAIAQRYLGVPYVWGGASPTQGFDCSGLVMYVFAQVGISLPHGATMQQRMSTPVPLNALESGDLVFFGDASFSYHVGIYVGGGEMIAAPHTGAVVSYESIAGAWIGGQL